MRMVLRKRGPPKEWGDVRFGNLDDIAKLYEHKKRRGEWAVFEDGEQAYMVAGSRAAAEELEALFAAVDARLAEA